jgi:hypothetical protein
MSTDWIARRVAEAQAAVKGTPDEVPDAVAEAFRSLLADQLQIRLKPEEVKGVVIRLAAANSRAAE